MSGFGSSFAVTPYGAGTPAETTAPPSSLPEGAAFIDPTTRDHVYGDDGELERMPSVRQQFVLALTTTLGSSSVDQKRGILAPKLINANTPQRMREAVTRAVAHITSAGRAVLLDVKFEQSGTLGGVTTVSYRDLTTDQNDIVRF